MTDKTLSASFDVSDDHDVLLTVLVRKGEHAPELVGAEVLGGAESDVLSVWSLRHANDGRPRLMTVACYPGEREARVLHVGVLAG